MFTRDELAGWLGLVMMWGMASDTKTLTVTRLVRKMRNLLEVEMGQLWVEGEVSNLRKQASGHLYFTLKDEAAQISCVMFRGNAVRSKVQPDNGMLVRIFGEVSVYEARGSLQLVATLCEAAGEGDLQAQFEALKRKLEGEGLFDSARKKALPSFPRAVGLITSGSGAALQDMLNVLGRRAPWVQPVLYPVQVQGKGAELGIAEALRHWNDPSSGLPAVDVIIVGRGGGSLEDLWNFNEEVVARAIADSSIPVVSAVGHEIDFTIADFVADMRAPTPSAAAELVVPDGAELARQLARSAGIMQRCAEGRLRQYEVMLNGMKRGPLSLSIERVLREPMQNLLRLEKEMEDVLDRRISEKAQQLQALRQRHALLHPERVLIRKEIDWQRGKKQLESALEITMEKRQQRLLRNASLLRALGPESAFSRGFSLTMDEQGKLIRSVKDVASGQRLVTRLADGDIRSDVVH